MHRIDVGLVTDLEPVNPVDVPVTAVGALKSYKLAAKAISWLQSLPSRNISLLCDVLVREVSDLTGYERVMAYKFHEDEHGEVIAECRKSDLEPDLGLHYPATDIPQSSPWLPTSASLVMSITICEHKDEATGGDQQQKGQKLWGLVVCHHTSPMLVPFPLRYACEFLIQVFGVQLNKEVELAAQTKEMHILQTQPLLCDMLLRDASIGIFTQSPNDMDLVKSDGAALYF
ncbi:hypothetical protein MUK42_34505 [Musa troglodytarum]|uniref:GAF domain-containing protein n=1 Tax=Musa troglodytarum TaxID=320322 RepID=A0A9E7JZP2_9LILI|nr:hypothetical protein MUK42_34505 [Musa troglodytarum]